MKKLTLCALALSISVTAMAVNAAPIRYYRYYHSIETYNPYPNCYRYPSSCNGYQYSNSCNSCAPRGCSWCGPSCR